MNLLQFFSVASFKIKSDEEYRKAEMLEVLNRPAYQWLAFLMALLLFHISIGLYSFR